MREPPGISTATILASVEAHYGIRLASLSWLPFGADSHAWVARGQGQDGDYVLKLRADALNTASVQLARHLYDHGLAQIVAPVATTTQRLWVHVGELTLILYPFIDGRPGAEGGLAQAQWAAFGALIRQLHTLPLPPDLAARLCAETWTPFWPSQIAALTAAADQADSGDAVGRDFVALWRAQSATIALLARRAEALAETLRPAAAPLVLCHADLHTWNVLVDRQERIWIIDWDTAMLGRKERDLMFAVEGISHDLVTPEATGWFFQGYGPTTLDQQALAYYRYAWAIQDCIAFGEEILLRPELGAESRQRALRLFTQLFEPGQIVPIALAGGDIELDLP
jgi:spectinomycin phosphotransferase